MEDASAGGGAAPTSAVGGLGNYKGVMLCSRPPEDGVKAGGAGGPAVAPFKSTIAASVGEQLGLPPPKRDEPKFEVKTRGPSAALRRHCQWIKELQEQVGEDQRQAEASIQAQEERKAKMQVTFKQQRDAIRRIKSERDRSNIDPADVEAILRPGAKRAGGVEAARKPLWAMTEDEKEGVEDEEAAQLIRFVEDLDFDRYIDDLEFKEHLQIVRDRARRLQREQDAFKDSLVREFNIPTDGAFQEGDDWPGAASSCGDGSLSRAEDRARGRRPGSLPDDRPDWDASTANGDDRMSVDREAHGAAEKLLEANPQLRAIHSKGSVQKLIEKAQEME